ncbi:MAG: hypothetical protein ACFB5Z_14505 [Elainellaceae cyanobacterium]
MTRTITKATLTLLLLGLIFAPLAGLAPLLIVLLIAVVAWNIASLFSDDSRDVERNS